MEIRNIVAVLAMAGISAVLGYTAYQYIKYGKPPGAVQIVAIPALTGVMAVAMSPTYTHIGALKAGGFIPPVLGG